MRKIEDVWCDKSSKILIQNPGSTNAIRFAVTMLDYGLKEQIPSTYYGNRDTKRKLYIYKHMIWIVESNVLNTIYIRNNVSEPCRHKPQYEQVKSYNLNLAYEDPLTFNYWKFPAGTFDVIISPNPVRLEMLKEDGIIL